jgi:hypothetical protein
MARHLGLRHREAHVREEAALAALADVRSVSLVRLARARADDVEAELLHRTLELARVMPRIVPREGDPHPRGRGPEVLRYEDAPDPAPGPARC